jgi:hypothetical protein
MAMVTASFDNVGSVDGRFRRQRRPPATVRMITVMATGGFENCGPRMKEIGVVFKYFVKNTFLLSSILSCYIMLHFRLDYRLDHDFLFHYHILLYYILLLSSYPSSRHP